MKERINVDSEAGPLGPYSSAIRANGLIFVSGQIPLNPDSGEVVAGSIQDQVRQVLDNTRALLQAAGSSLDKALKCTVYLTDLGDADAMNEVYATYFTGEAPPARTTIEAAQLPKGVAVEIDVIAEA
ncbi:MAG: Rid family detoxifying hydrolase [Acidobacteriota bacterium]|nr:Rid family detoxifying hydrolase [Acidobacteriota bacterium]